MKALHKTSLWESLLIQKRVIGALLMREIITRYGRNNIGFLWLFVEPLVMTLLIVLLWGSIRADRYSTLNIMAFMLTGYPIAMMWRNVSNRAIGAISPIPACCTTAMYGSWTPSSPACYWKLPAPPLPKSA